ncbi:MAG: hypothetical protein IJE25_01470 [Clostridia bacterium]|nr:hypothetical protein [Clostridia bacterium]
MKDGKKRRHPYATLALFTLAGASMINLYNKTKGLVKTGLENVKSMMKK